MTHITLTNATIAPLIGGTYNWDEMRIELPSGLFVFIDTQHNNKLRIACREMESLGKIDRYGRNYPDFPKIGCSADKSPDAIARDIRKRVIEPGEKLLPVVRALIDKAGQDRAQLIAHINALPKWIHCNVPSNPAEYSATYSGKVPQTDCFISGRVNSWGSISIDRITSLDAATALRVFAALESVA